ncbi:MAG TPA: FeoA family protein [Polyangiaceae bacterium]|nr:FeoA family protein [Polyangiaceae bacterium]
MKLCELPLGSVASIVHVGGEGAFRRRLMELGLLPGTQVEVVAVAPLGDPLELLVRGASLSIRRAEALTVEVSVVADRQHDAVRKTASAKPAPEWIARGTP